MIENTDRLLTVMAISVAKGLDSRAWAVRNAGPDTPNGIRQCKTLIKARRLVKAALLAAQAEGAEMVPRNPTPDMTATGWPSRAVEGDLRMIWGFYSDMLSANPLRIKEEPWENRDGTQGEPE